MRERTATEIWGDRTRPLALLVLGVVALAGCGFGNPWPTEPAPQPHHTLLVLGDSLAGQTDVTLSNVLAAHGLPTTVIDAHVNGSGLIGPVGDAPDALTYVQRRMESNLYVDTVLIEWAGACGVCGTLGYPAYSSPEFYAAWRAEAHAIIDYLHTQDVAVVWTISPPMGVDSTTAASGSQVAVNTCLVLSWVDKGELAPAASAGVVDWYEALSDTGGNYQTSLFYDGGTHQVRLDDLVHLTLDGSARTSTWTAHGLGALWNTIPAPDVTTQGDTQSGLVEVGDPVTLDVHWPTPGKSGSMRETP